MTEKQPRILIIGGGFGGLFAVLDLAGTGDITLVSDEDHFLFAPMLYEYLSGEVQAWHIAPDYKELLEKSVHFVKGVVSAIDLDRREVTIEGRPEKLSYD
ncbi:MAG: FAD-dependent oxidoreductase, partial [Acidobacteria bacterium]